MQTHRRGFLKLLGLSSAVAVPSAAAAPLLLQTATAEEMEAAYSYELRRVIPSGLSMKGSDFYEHGVQPLSVIIDHMQARSKSKYMWVITKLDPV